MTDTPQGFRYDPEMILPDDDQVKEFIGYREGDESPKVDRPADENTLWITGLTDLQFDALKQAVSKDPRNRTQQVVGKVSALSFLMLLVAATLWLIVFIASNLPTR